VGPPPTPGRSGGSGRPGRSAGPSRAGGPGKPGHPHGFPALVKALPQHRPWIIALSAIAVAVVVTACSLGAFLVVNDDAKKAAATPTAAASPTRDIDNRTVDPKLLTVRDVLPTTKITADPAVPAYQVLGAPQVTKDCRIGATGNLGKLLLIKGCNQVVRATVLSPDKQYLITLGIFNLIDDTAATDAYDEIKPLVAADKGRFTGYITTDATKILGRASTRLSWLPSAHFLAYCVIARVTGKQFAATDPNPRIIVYDLVEQYLRDRVLANWSIDRNATGPAAAPS
jgi:hypothetical protein